MSRTYAIDLMRSSLILIGIGTVGLVISIILYVKIGDRPHPTAVQVDSTPAITKLSPREIATYSVPTTNPKYIAIPSIGLGNTPIVRLGLLSNGAINTPDTIYEAGWFEDSALPGQPGAMFIYGHVSSWSADGIFFNLKKLKPGDKVTVTRGDNKTYTYQVVTSHIYPYNNVDMKTVLSPINPKLPGLNLMTCTGTVIPNTSEFTERLVVFTSLVQS